MIRLVEAKFQSAFDFFGSREAEIKAGWRFVWSSVQKNYCPVYLAFRPVLRPKIVSMSEYIALLRSTRALRIPSRIISLEI